MRPIEDAGKNGWTMADFSVMTVAVDLEPQQINHADWGCIVFSDEFFFQLCPDYHRRRVWRRPSQHAESAFTIARHTYSQPGVMVWDAIYFEAGPLWSSLEAQLQHSGTLTTF
ncbi:uncharacterized protein TNCV_492441 [Trichonephila clavipes]|nr:uncharacterized protein TNCV_492441 [Trichonephila clavipes]